jgi:hypothetical protein
MMAQPRSGGKDEALKPREGMGEAGAPFHPATEPDPGGAAPDEPRFAPSPGVPMAKETYERLKERARTEETRPSVRPQADPSGRPKGKGHR